MPERQGAHWGLWHPDWEGEERRRGEEERKDWSGHQRQDYAIACSLLCRHQPACVGDDI